MLYIFIYIYIEREREIKVMIQGSIGGRVSEPFVDSLPK